MITHDHYVIRGASEAVELWSTDRLQFQPRGWQVAMREQLRDALRTTDPSGPESVLHATYMSNTPDAHRTDAENVLFYNVGSGCFGGISGYGVRFERMEIAPPNAPASISLPVRHYHRYTPADRSASFQGWQRGSTLAEWRDVPYVAGVGPASIWRALHEARVSANRPAIAPSAFAVRATIRPAEGARVRPIGAIKQLFDGVISAFHVHSGQDIEIVAERIGEQVGLSRLAVEQALASDERAVLGLTRLVQPFRSGVQWCPRDDLCVAGELLVSEPQPSGVRAAFSGELFEVKPV